jgi:hypothetical protein
MDVLCVRFSALAFTGIETLMANSLVPFATPANDSNSHNFSSKIVAHLGQSFGYEADPFLRSHAEIAPTVASYHFARRPPTTPPPPLTSIFSRPSRQSFDRAASEPIARRMTRSSCMAATTSGSAGGSNRTSQKSGPRQKSRTCNCPHHRCETLPPSEKNRPSALRRGPETGRTEAALGHRAC